MKEKDILKNADKMFKSYEIHSLGFKCTNCLYKYDETCIADMLEDFYKLSKALKNENQGLKKEIRQMIEYTKDLKLLFFNGK